MHRLTIPTSKKEELIEITEQVQDAISRSNISEGICTVFIPHTTAGVTVNENADPSVRHDFIYALRTLFSDLREFTHSEGNSPAHIKASLVGPSQTLLSETEHLFWERGRESISASSTALGPGEFSST